MFKNGARVGCGLAATIYISANGEVPTSTVRHGELMDLGVEADGTLNDFEGASRSLLQGTSVSSANKYRMQSANLVDELKKLTTGAKELPASIKSFIVEIRKNAGEIKTRLVDEHVVQKNDLDAKYNAFAACEATLVTATADATSKGTTAGTKGEELCNCWEDKRKAALDSQGCQDELKCRTDDVALKLKKKTDFLMVDGITTDLVDQYEDTDGTSLCVGSDAWKQQEGASDDAKALAWLDSQKVESNTHWTGKKSALQILIDAHATARDTRDKLRDGTDEYLGKGCDELKKLLGTKETECTTKIASAELAYCNQYNSEKAGCDAYEACRTVATRDWEAAKLRETRDSQDRKNAWVSAAMVRCLADTFTDNEAGNVEIDASKFQACEALTCDTVCIAALDLSESLNRKPPAATACITPSPTPPCTCDAVNWKAVTPLYFVGERTGAVCHVPAVEVGSANVPNPTCSSCGDSTTEADTQPVTTTTTTTTTTTKMLMYR